MTRSRKYDRLFLCLIFTTLVLLGLRLMKIDFPLPYDPNFPLRGVTLVLDPGHGDRSFEQVPSDPGATADTPEGLVRECILTWDTTMRIKRLAESKGADVYLTVSDPNGDYAPKAWNLRDFPLPGEPAFKFKELIERPRPRTVHEALASRVETANRIYSERSSSEDVYFFSIHFDSTNPDLEGVSFYYPKWQAERPMIGHLLKSIRHNELGRKSLWSGVEWSVGQAATYTVLALAENPDSYLMELGNLRSCDPNGHNPDLARMMRHQSREQYAQLIVQALVSAKSPH